MRKIAVLISLLCLCVVSLAQTGVVSGVVLDSKTSEPLIGASVGIEGTTQGASVDIDGRFTIKAVKPGMQTLVISFISYATQKQKVMVTAEKESVIKVKMEEASVELKEAVATGKRRSETDASVMKTMKASDLVVSGISSQLITKTQDKDAAEVIKKVPGITINDGRFVIVRGLNERYNTVWLNGATAPSFESDSRAFSFDAIPSSMIGNILIFKTPAPELPADFAGASIKLITKNDVEKNSLKISYSAGFVPGVTGKQFFVQDGNASQWLGYDNSRALPASYPSTAQMNDLANQTADESAEKKAGEIPQLIDWTNRMSDNIRWTPRSVSAAPNQSASLSLARKMSIGSASLSNLTSVNYGVSNERETVARQFYDENQQIYTYRYDDEKYARSVKLGVIHSWQLAFSNRHKIEFRHFLNQMGKSEFTERNGIEFDNNNRVIRSQDMSYFSRTIYSGQLAGEHSFRDQTIKLDWLGGFSYSNKQMPDERRFLWEYDTTKKVYRFQLNTSPDPFVGSRYFQNLQENVYNAALNYEQKIDLFHNANPWTLKAGVFYEEKHRQFDMRNLGYVAAGSNLAVDVTQPIDSILQGKNYYLATTDTVTERRIQRIRTIRGVKDTVWKIIKTPVTRNGILIKENTTASDSYKAQTSLVAGYAALRIPFGQLAALYGGLRVERFAKYIYDFYPSELAQSVKDSLAIRTSEFNLFPSINASINVSASTLLRLSYGRTINRPELREMAPFSFNNFSDKSLVIGNTSLHSARIDNVDLRWEWYPSKSEMVSLAAFYKRFNDPIELVYESNKGSGITLVPQNSGLAQSRGLELDVRKSLAGLENSSWAWWLKNITLVMNASVISSIIHTTQQTAREDSRPMQGQSPYIINVGPYYQNEKTGTMVSLMYNRIGKRIVFTGNNQIPHYWELPQNSLDLTVSQRLYKKLEMKAGVKNILASQRHIVTYEGVRDEGAEHDIAVYSAYRMFTLGLSYSF